MDKQSSSIAQMVAEILARMPALDVNRRQMLLCWLQAHHSSACITEANVSDDLNKWFGKLPAEGIDWEYHLILSEIAWWRDLDEDSLAQFMAMEGPSPI
jgi:hypothetical protein